MEQHSVILGLSRQAKLAGLPLPYAVGVGSLLLFPFIWTEMFSWLVTAPLWYGAAKLSVALNPNGHKALMIYLRKTPPRLSLAPRKGPRDYV